MYVKAIICLIIFNYSVVASGLTCDDGYISYKNTCVECGLTYYQPNVVKIVGGVDAVPNSWPSIALISQNYKGYHVIGGRNVLIDKKYQCAGTLINSFTILTAAHCTIGEFKYNGNSYQMNFLDNPFYVSLASTYTIYLGLHDTSFLDYDEKVPSPPAVEFSVSNIIMHPYFEKSNIMNDITLIILSTEVTFNKFIQPACIPPYSFGYPIANNTIGYVSGWGSLYYDGYKPYYLNNINITIYNMSSCNNVFPSMLKNTNYQICAGDLLGGKDSCQGDSGGGMYILDTFGGKQRYMVSGITSYGDGCAKAGYPGIYTRVSSYTTWITANWKESVSTVTEPTPSTTSKTNSIPFTKTSDPIKRSTSVNTSMQTSTVDETILIQFNQTNKASPVSHKNNNIVIGIAIGIPLGLLFFVVVVLALIIGSIIYKKRKRQNNIKVPRSHDRNEVVIEKTSFRSVTVYQPYIIQNYTINENLRILKKFLPYNFKSKIAKAKKKEELDNNLNKDKTFGLNDKKNAETNESPFAQVIEGIINLESGYKNERIEHVGNDNHVNEIIDQTSSGEFHKNPEHSENELKTNDEIRKNIEMTLNDNNNNESTNF